MGQRELGAGMIVLGLGLSALSMASPEPGGGGYLFFGLIVAGLVQLFR